MIIFLFFQIGAKFANTGESIQDCRIPLLPNSRLEELDLPSSLSWGIGRIALVIIGLS